MPEKKFDLSKALQAAQLYTPIDYGYIPQFDIQTSQDNFNNTVDNILSDINWIGSGVRARKEEQEKRDNTPWYSKLGYAAMSSSNPGDVPATSALATDRYMVGDVEGGKNTQKTQDIIGSIAGTAAALGPYAIADFAKTAGTYGVGSALDADDAASQFLSAGLTDVAAMARGITPTSFKYKTGVGIVPKPVIEEIVMRRNAPAGTVEWLQQVNAKNPDLNSTYLDLFAKQPEHFRKMFNPDGTMIK